VRPWLTVTSRPSLQIASSRRKDEAAAKPFATEAATTVAAKTAAAMKNTTISIASMTYDPCTAPPGRHR
jgi:hypothetical protein